MWNELLKELSDFPDSVLTSLDTQDYPFSIRTRCEPVLIDQVLRVQVPTYTRVHPGPASLLCHRHDDLLWNLKSFTVRGFLELDDQGWLFRPQKMIAGAGIGGMLAMVKFLRDGRRSAKQYLEKRGLTRPKIDWDAIHAMWAEIHREEK